MNPIRPQSNRLPREWASGAVLPLFVFWLVLVLAPSARGQVENGWKRTQVLSLSKGWNAVFLEVEPTELLPEKVFSGSPVDKVATWFARPSSHWYFSDQEIDLSKSAGWSIWYASDLPESFLGTLDAIYGNRSYLIHATQSCSVVVKGRTLPTKVEWRPDAFNFVGFPLKSVGAPTYGEFFAGSDAHRDQAIYRLVSGRWKKVVSPATTMMKKGEAFWIHCEGASDYQGPLTVEVTSSQGLLLGSGVGQVVLRNSSPNPISPVIEHLVGEGPAVPLSIVVTVYGDLADPVGAVGAEKPASGWTQDIPPLEEGAAIAVPFECRKADMSQPEQGSMLKFSSDLGTEVWVPVTALRDD